MMLDHLGETEAAAAVMSAIESVLAHGGDSLTPDMGGSATTNTLGDNITRELIRLTTGSVTPMHPMST